MKLSIIILALESRRNLSPIDKVREQIIALDTRQVEVIEERDAGQYSSGFKRQVAMAKARGEYVCFLDDDDDVSENYVKRLLEATYSGVDVIAFNLLLHNKDNNKREKWKFGLHDDYRSLGLMAVNHLCAWRTSLAKEVAWCAALGYGDDQLWYGPLLKSNKVKTVYRIDEILYLYNYSTVVTANQTEQRMYQSRAYFGNGLRCYMEGPNIFVQDGQNINKVRDKHNQVCEVRPTMNQYHVVVLK